MDSYFELKAIPDAELLQSAVVAQLMQTVHGLLPAFEGDVGLSFPGYGQARTLGGILRFHGGRQQLEQLSHQLCQNPTINSYALVTEVNAVPDRINGHAIFQRLHVKGESRIKRWRKHNQENGTWTAEREQAVTAKYRENIICPHVALKSHSTGQSRFLLFIQRRVSGEEVEGKLNAYGLSKTATVPWF